MVMPVFFVHRTGWWPSVAFAGVGLLALLWYAWLWGATGLGGWVVVYGFLAFLVIMPGRRTG